MIEAVLAHEEVAGEGPGHVGEERDRPRVQVAVEEPLLHEVDERPGPEDAHELVEGPEHRRRGSASPRPGGRPAGRAAARSARPACSPSVAWRRVIASAWREQRLVVAGEEGGRARSAGPRGRSGARGPGPATSSGIGRWLRGARAAASAAVTPSMPRPRVATVVRTGMPSAASSPRRSTRIPRASASSCMFRTRTVGTSSWPSCRVSSSARRRFLASATWTTTAPSSPRTERTSSQVTCSSSLSGRSELRPGESMTSASVAGEAAPVDLDGRAGVVGDGGAQAGEGVEEGALADVGVAEQDDPPRGARGAPASGRHVRRPSPPLRRRVDPETEFQLRRQSSSASPPRQYFCALSGANGPGGSTSPDP